jgi:hypothetical protein
MIATKLLHLQIASLALHVHRLAPQSLAQDDQDDHKQFHVLFFVSFVVLTQHLCQSTGPQCLCPQHNTSRRSRSLLSLFFATAGTATDTIVTNDASSPAVQSCGSTPFTLDDRLDSSLFATVHLSYKAYCNCLPWQETWQEQSPRTVKAGLMLSAQCVNPNPRLHFSIRRNQLFPFNKKLSKSFLPPRQQNVLLDVNLRLVLYKQTNP